MKNINLGAHFLFLLILCSIKIERLLFLKFLKILAFFDSYFWPFNKSEEKIKVIFVISVIMPSIWNVFIKFRWCDEKFTAGLLYDDFGLTLWNTHLSSCMFVFLVSSYYAFNRESLGGKVKIYHCIYAILCLTK